MQLSRHHVGPRMSQMVVHNDTIYLCGQTAEGTSDTVEGQTCHILQQIDALLAEAGSSKSKLLQAQIWLADIRGYDAMNAVWDGWVDPDNTPARATCEARMAYPSVLVEIMATASR